MRSIRVLIFLLLVQVLIAQEYEEELTEDLEGSASGDEEVVEESGSGQLGSGEAESSEEGQSGDEQEQVQVQVVQGEDEVSPEVPFLPAFHASGSGDYDMDEEESGPQEEEEAVSGDIELEGSGAWPAINSESSGDLRLEGSADWDLYYKGSGQKEESTIQEAQTNATEEENLPIKEAITGDCSQSDFGCCPDGITPAHGPESLGCCATTEYGCCADNVQVAEGPYSEGCSCKDSEFGCCPDETSLAQGPAFKGCGCQYEEHGCCPDQTTQASGPNYEGCSCSTYEFGCCPDGVSVARGSNMEDCPECNSEFGCCPDGVTPRTSEDELCGCEASEFGCCLDGLTPARGLNFQGCDSIPGEGCLHRPKQGPCTEYESKWFYDSEYGGCNRFWYGGCEPGTNHFDEEQECQARCVSPRGSGVCFLEKVVGPCEGKYEEWYYDYRTKRCSPFVYGGCLGNGNRFLTKESCEDMCTKRSDTPVCEKPLAEGACSGNFSRWYYDKSEGKCQPFLYSGCRGNNNRFMSEAECQVTCSHKAKQLKTDLVCKMYIEKGNGSLTFPRWGYNDRLRRCVPFYYGGEAGNDNNFLTREACELVCPTTFPAIVSFPRGDEILVERRTPELVLQVSVRANPPATVTWIRQGQAISKFDYRYEILSDNSLKLKDISDLDAGSYTIQAENGIGEPASRKNGNAMHFFNMQLPYFSTLNRTVNVVVYPLYTKVSIEMDKSIFKPETEVTVLCEVQGYPPPEIQWYKLAYRRGGRAKERMEEDRRHVIIETYQLTSTMTSSNLILRNVSEVDSGNYRCEAFSDFFPPVGVTQGIRIQYGPGERCIDRPSYTHCDMVVKHKFCGNKYYGQYCCKSCTEAGFLPGGLQN